MARETSDFNRTPSANRLHISFFGRRNAGKSSVVNAITGQELSSVAQVLGTTTDPVKDVYKRQLLTVLLPFWRQMRTSSLTPYFSTMI